MNIVKIIKKAPKDHVYWCTLFGSCRVSVNTDEEDTPIVVYGSEESELTEDGRLFPDAYDGECVLFPSKDNRDWADFESELDDKAEKQPKFIPADDDSKHSIEVGDTFNGSVEMVSIPDRPMMAAVICAGLLAGGCKDKGAALINKAANYADMILEYTKEESAKWLCVTIATKTYDGRPATMNIPLSSGLDEQLLLCAQKYIVDKIFRIEKEIEKL